MKNIIVTLAFIAALFSLTAFRSSEEGKIIMTVTHEVKDYAEWKKAFDEGEAGRTKAGMKVAAILTSVDNPNVVTVVSEVPSVEAAKNFGANPQLKAAMEKAGVISKPEVRIMNKVQ